MKFYLKMSKDILCLFGLIRVRIYVVVVEHVTIVAIGHGMLKKFWLR